MGDSSTEFKFLDRASNLKLMCNGCSISGVKLDGGNGHEDIFRGIEELKDTQGKAKSVVQSLNSLATAPEAEDSDVLKLGNENAPELGCSGIDE